MVPIKFDSVCRQPRTQHYVDKGWSNSQSRVRQRPLWPLVSNTGRLGGVGFWELLVYSVQPVWMHQFRFQSGHCWYVYLFHAANYIKNPMVR